MKITLTTAHTLAAAIAGVVLCVSILDSAANHSAASPVSSSFDLAVVYFLAALPLAASFAVAVIAKLPRQASTLAILGLDALALFVLPRLYIRARCENDLTQATQLARQFRYAETSALLHRVGALEPKTLWNDAPVAQAAHSIAQIVRQVEAQVAVPLAGNATDEIRLQRAAQLAVLARTSEAFALLDTSESLTNSPQALNLRGTIHESRSRWNTARDLYARAKAAAEPLPDSPARTAALQQATTGIAFCERKLGHLRKAESAWLDLLALAPTAESHFLVAQFYDDTQQATKAQFHARQAMQLDPNGYAQQAERLLDKLVTSHFGCLGVFSAEKSPSTPFGAATLGNK